MGRLRLERPWSGRPVARAPNGGQAAGALKLPPTVQGMLAARIDRLAPAQKELLQTLAVLGKEFAFSLVRGVTGREDDEYLNRFSAHPARRECPTSSFHFPRGRGMKRKHTWLEVLCAANHSREAD
jgi:hypothetical protein